QELDNFGLAGKAIIPVDLRKDNFETLVFEKMNNFESSVKAELVDGQIKILDEELFKQGQLKLNRLKAADKFSVLFNINHEVAQEMSHSMQFVVNKYGRIKNVLSSSGQHLASFRLGDGGLSLNNSGAIELFARRRKQLPKTFSQTSIAPYTGEGLAVVVVDDDAEPFIRKGRNVFHGFVLACDPWLRPGEACLICDKAGNLLGHGVSVSTVEDLASMKKGVAIKTRDGIKEDA
ncbi:MAG: PUA domain-containing protein, partial [Candidatus Thermoplasmatota archaeon]|nr:PUA domain-containing protein [Candidatus Thermoplasmatota archaeon]